MVIEVLLFLLAYLAGSLSSAVMVCRLLVLPDPRLVGSHNPGATNVLRIGGKRAAILTLTGDLAKGVLPVLLAKWLEFSLFHQALVGLFAFIGHLFPAFFSLKGGKGVATFFGMLTALYWPLGLSCLAIWLLMASVFRFSSLAAIITAVSCPLLALSFQLPHGAVWVLVVLTGLLIARHHRNIHNLRVGEEPRIGGKKSRNN